MKIKASNAHTFVRHCDNLKTLTGLAYGLEVYTKLRRVEVKLNRLMNTACERPLTDLEESQVSKLVNKVEAMLLPEYREQFFCNHDPRGYALKLHTKASAEDIGKKADQLAALPNGFYADWGGFAILAPEF